MSQAILTDEVAKVLEKIRLLRNEKKMTIFELADKAELSRSYIYYLETKQKIPTLTVLFRLAKALDVDIKEFFL